MDVRLPDGTIISNVPEGTTKADLVAKLKANGMNVPAEWLPAEAPAAAPQRSQSIGATLRDIPRQVGLTARYGLEGLGGAANIITEPLRQIVLNPVLRAAGLPQARSTGDAATGLADAIGLPSPQTADERTVGDASRMVAGAGGVMSAANATARALAPGVAQRVAQTMGARPGIQMAGAAGAGAAGGAVREDGGGPLEQFGAALAGGLAAGGAAGGLERIGRTGANALRNLLTPRAVQLQQADQQINLVLTRNGVNWAEVPERIRQNMRNEVSAAMATGQQLDDAAMQRLLVFQRANLTPTVGQLRQDPGMITREKNLAKTGANSTDPALQRLPNLESDNVRSALSQLDEAGAARATTPAAAGRRAIESMDATAQRAQDEIGGLYNTARDSAGRSLPLEGGTFTRRANELLDQANIGSFLPPDVARTMNRIAVGEIPLTVEVAEQIKTNIGNIQRSSADGNVRRALGLVRQALDDAPLQNGRTFNPGNVPAVAGTVPPSTAAAGEEAIGAFNAARQANRAWMQRIERNPALRAVVEGVEPDQFVQRYVIGRGATAADVRSLAGELDPQAQQAMKDYLVRYLRDRATGGDADINKFAGKAYRDALRDLREKLPAFFSREEIDQLEVLGDAVKYMQSQPAGSAVNNSSSGALVLGRGLDAMQAMAQRLPIGRDAITGLLQGQQQRLVMEPRNALVLAANPQARGQTVNPLLAAAVAGGEEPRKNNRRD